MHGGSSKLEQLLGNKMVKIIDKYFQKEFDDAMNRSDLARKQNSLTLSALEKAI